MQTSRFKEQGLNDVFLQKNCTKWRYPPIPVLQGVLHYIDPSIFTAGNLHNLCPRGNKKANVDILTECLEYCTNVQADSGVPEVMRTSLRCAQHAAEQYALLGSRGQGLVVGKPWEETGVYGLDFASGKLTIHHKFSNALTELPQAGGLRCGKQLLRVHGQAHSQGCHLRASSCSALCLHHGGSGNKKKH
eukprot:5935641-Amphidinium_carterae.2